MAEQETDSGQKIYCFEEGKLEAIRKIGESASKPVIAAFFGVPDSGKTHLIDLIAASAGLKTINQPIGYVDWKTSHEHCSPFTFIKDIESYLIKEFSDYELIMYHCPWDNRSEPWREHFDPEEALRRFLNRGLDLSIGIFNPKRSRIPLGDYDLIISNPRSSEKPWYPDD